MYMPQEPPSENGSSREEYESILSPTGTDTAAPNTVVTLSAHLGEPKVDHPQYTQPSLTETDMSLLADGLANRDAYDESARLEIERRHFASDEQYAPMFTVFELTAIALQLVGLRLEAAVFDDSDTYRAVNNFADVIDESETTPLDARYKGVDEWPVRHIEGDYLDPFCAIAGIQTCILTIDGEPVVFDEDQKTICDGTPVSRADLPSFPAWVPHTEYCSERS